MRLLYKEIDYTFFFIAMGLSIGEGIYQNRLMAERLGGYPLCENENDSMEA